MRIKEKIAIYLSDDFGEIHAIANEIAVILQAARKESFARGLDGAG